MDNPALDLFDGRLRSALIRIINTSLSDTQWLQASLSIKHGGLGIRQVLLVLHAFLASAASTSDLQSQILLASACTADTQFDTYLADWQVAHGPLSPSDPLPVKQSVWDKSGILSSCTTVESAISGSYQQWRSQYGATAPSGLPRTTSANRANPMKFLEG